MLKIKKLPVQKLKFSKINKIPFDDDNAEPEFEDAKLDTGRLFNGIRNSTVRGYHMDNLTDLSSKKVERPVEKKARKSMMKRIPEREVLESAKLNIHTNRGYKKLGEFKKGQVERLMFNPYDDYDARGEEGVRSGISTEQQDDLIPNQKDAFQKVNLVEPYFDAKKLNSLKLKKLPK